MRKYPIACAVAIISLAMGIGATTGMLTIRNAVFRNPPPFSPHPEELLEAFMPTPQRSYRAAVPAGVFNLWTDETRVHAGIAGAAPNIAREVRTPESVEMLSVRAVTPQLFRILGVAPVVGRSLSDESTAVISHRLWQRSFRGQPGALGSVLWIDGKAHTVVGIMPERFWVFDFQTDIWTPLDLKALPSDALLEVIVRRRPEVTNRAVTDAFENDVVRYINALPNVERRARVQIMQMQGTPIGHAIAPAVVWLIAACVVLTLLIACTNVAVLVIAQWTGREREFAICAALGAGRWRIVRGLLTESLLLALFGGTLGVSATFVFLAVALRRAPSSVDFNFAVDAGVLIRTALITVSAGILAGLAPALYETQRSQANPLRGIPSDRVRQRWRNALVVAEITVTIALLVVTSTIVDGYRRAISEDLGYDIKPLLAVAVETQQGVRMAEIHERLRALPGVISVAATTAPAMNQGSRKQLVALDGSGSNSMMAQKAIVSSDFWKTLAIPIRIGRGFSTEEDRPNAAPVVIVNEALAERMWPGRNPIGIRLWTEGRGFDVVAVAADYKNVPLSIPTPAFFLSISGATSPLTQMTFYVRTSGIPGDLLQSVRSEIRGAAPENVVSSVFTLQSIVDVIGLEILTAVYPMTPLIATGLLLSAAGIYGVLAFAVARRSRELAIRVAVGATAGQLVRLVAVLSVRLVGLGILFGIGATFGLSRLAQGQGGVFDSPRFGVFIVPMIIVIAIGLLATWMPSRQALSVNPARLLRTE